MTRLVDSSCGPGARSTSNDFRAPCSDPNTACSGGSTPFCVRGAARLHGVDPHDAALRSAAAVVGEIRATNYGVTWEIEATVEPVSAVDSERHLFAHTDLPYREVAPGVQLLLAVVVDVPGGESTLVDGYAVAEQLRTVDPDAWRLLTTTESPTRSFVTTWN